ncbi:interferon-induced protein 44-like isoform X1 [Sinocyclocheilus rhinocerous]|uniref:Interferon-induced protein 44-like n=1 Tax=Sinocyclocheilus rhinocerous TaxID=307959 RepID=A0A673ML58_9TELE|nr:PREDICTED: interferon-induced protein 44-like isoform X1 [Sinocyclocheilus rhinocerous]
MSFFGTPMFLDTKSSTTPTIPSFGLATSSGTKSTAAAVPTFASLATSSETSSTPAKASFALAASSGTKSDRNKPKKVAVPQFSLGAEFPLLLENEWRNMKWSEEVRETLMESVRSFKPASETVTEARVLLIGPVGAGKSSFISSVQSVFSGRVINRAMVGSSSSTSFTKKLRSYNIRGAGEKADEPTALVLCDVMGVGEGESTGLTLHDALSVIKGCAPEGHQFSPEQPIGAETVGFIRKPSTNDKVHCVVFVIDGSSVGSYAKSFGATFQQLREHISNLGVHQVALLTHVDQVCTATRSDITKVYKSQAVQQAMVKAAELLGMATSYIVPVKNYCSELDLDENTDILLLNAVDHILQYVNLYFQDNSD